MVGHVVNPSTKFEDSMAIRSRVMSSDISHRIPLTICLQPLHMCRITWPMRRGKFFPHIWNPRPRFAHPRYNFYGATIKTNGVICQNSVWPCAKEHTYSSLRMRKITSSLNAALSFHQVWSWWDHPLPSYSVIAADTLRDLVTLTFGLLTLVSGDTWRVTCSTPPPSLKILRLSVLELWVLTSVS